VKRAMAARRDLASDHRHDIPDYRSDLPYPRRRNLLMNIKSVSFGSVKMMDLPPQPVVESKINGHRRIDFKLEHLHRPERL